MSTLTANSAAGPSLSLKTLETADPGQTAQESGENCLLFWDGQTRSNESAIAMDFCSQSTDENFGPVCVCRHVSRLLLGHCFGAIPARSGAAPLCFDYAALRVMVPP